MNCFKIVSVLLSVIIFIAFAHGSHVTFAHDTQQKIKPFTLQDMENYFIIYPDRISIYDKIELFVETTKSTTLERVASAMNPQSLDALCILYDENNLGKKLQGEAHKKALKLLSSDIVIEFISKGFVKSLEEIIVNNSIDINKAPNDEMSCIDCAIYNNKNDIIKLLIKLKADINQIKLKRTPLLIAICSDREEIVKTLLLAGADIKKMNDELWGKTTSYLNCRPEMQDVVAEVYYAREVEQRGLMDKLFIARRIAGKNSIGKMIISYLLGNNHKVCAIKKLQ